MVQFHLLRDLARKELTEYLDQFSGEKALVWDESLTGPIDLIANFQFLRDREVVKMFPLGKSRFPSSGIKNFVFITRPITDLMDIIADSIKREEFGFSGREEKPEYHILFVPTRSFLCEKRLKEKGVHGSFTFISELSLYWYPLETDLISMENSNVYREYHLEKDDTCLHPIAKGLMSLQALYGVIPNVYGKGKAARQLFDFMTIMRKELMEDFPQASPQIDSMIIFDRQIDLVSPMITQLTYEGLVDELFGIRQSSVKLPEEKFLKSADAMGHGSAETTSDSPFSTSGFKTFTLNSNEEIFADLRDKNFNAVGPSLSKKAKSVAAQFEERHTASTVKELKIFVEKMPQMQVMKQSLATHTSIAELIKERTDQRRFLESLQVEQELLNYHNVDRALEYVEDAACRNDDLVRLLRVVCLQSVVNSGLKPKVLEAYKRLLLQSYGYEHLLSLVNLEKLGLLSPQLATRNYPVLRKRLNLTLDDVDEQKPNDMAYVHSVYAPLSARLVQHFVQPGGWKAIRDVLDLLPGPTLEETQPIASHLKSKKSDAPRKILVVYVGGCTFAEISALRFLSSQEDYNSEIIVATTNVINGATFLNKLLHHIPTNDL